MFQIVNLINARRIGPYEYNTLEDVCANRPFIYMIVLLFAVQQVIIYEGGKYFKTAPLTVTQNLVCCLLALGSLVAFWVSKNLFSSHYLRKRQ
jgi:Ca2+ transporting ATPase